MYRVQPGDTILSEGQRGKDADTVFPETLSSGNGHIVQKR